MPRPRSAVPALLLHKRTGQSRVRIDGRDFYLGPHGSAEAGERYRRLVAEYLSTGTVPTPGPAAGLPDAGISINELVLAYWPFAEGYYRKNGGPTSELPLVRDALRLLRDHYGSTPAADFGPLRLKAVRETLIARGLCRKSINQRIGRVKRLFKWATENELVPATVHHGLTAVAGLRKGRTEAAEPDPVGPVPAADLIAVLPRLNRQLAAMVRLQSLTGMRPGEVCILRPSDVARGGEVWEYTPARFKTEHHGHSRRVYLGPRAQAMLAPWLDSRPDDAFCFSPAEARAERSAALRAARTTRVQPSQRGRRVKRPAKAPGTHYTTMSYGHAIRKACEAAGVTPWRPNQLRHSAGTAFRRAAGLEGAQVLLGHTRADVTQVYAARDADLARRVAAEVG